MNNIIKQLRTYNTVYNKVDDILNATEMELVHIILNVGRDTALGEVECINFYLNKATQQVQAQLDNDKFFTVRSYNLPDVVALIHNIYENEGEEKLRDFVDDFYEYPTPAFDYTNNNHVHYLYIK